LYSESKSRPAAFSSRRRAAPPGQGKIAEGNFAAFWLSSRAGRAPGIEAEILFAEGKKIEANSPVFGAERQKGAKRALMKTLIRAA
jgi:hypothetical protein